MRARPRLLVPPLTAALSEVPIDDREQPLLFHARTVDFQDVTVQATVTYRVADPAVAADPHRLRHRPRPGDVARAPARAGRQPAHRAGPAARARPARRHDPDRGAGRGDGAARERIASGLGEDRAWPTPAGRGRRAGGGGPGRARGRAGAADATREHVQQDADRATYERRALAVERERAIAENELQNQIELARREAQLVEQQGQNERSRATEAAAASRIEAEGQAERQRLLADAEAESTRLVGAAEAEAEGARLAAYDGVDESTLMGLAARELAGKPAPHQHAHAHPDLLTPILARLGAGRTATAAAEPKGAAGDRRRSPP
jgi:hypothetical protein